MTKEDFMENVGAFTGELFDLNDFIKHTGILALTSLNINHPPKSSKKTKKSLISI